jgi:Flp pilus assembly pilin Flp
MPQPQPHRRTIHLTDDRGQAMPEYALLIAFIALTVAAVLPLFGLSVSGLFAGFTAAMGG